MCDTFVIRDPDAGQTVLAKNSDRDPVEPQFIEIHPAGTWTDSDTVDCTWISIPQARETARILISRPAWMFGAEMGVNEYGVAIGNEALFTRKQPPESGLTGMDLLRLALERSRTACQALETITGLSDEFGQGGSCSLIDPGFRYFSSFMIADPEECWILQFTDSTTWTASRVCGPVAAISNRYRPDLEIHRSAGIEAAGPAPWDLARIKTWFGRGKTRQRRSEILAARVDPSDVTGIFKVLRDHGRYAGAYWAPHYSTTGQLCMHATSPINPGHTTGSMVVQLSGEGIDTWVTGTSSPCISVFKPVELSGPAPTGCGPDTIEAGRMSLWGRHDGLRRLCCDGYPHRAAEVRQVYNALEAEFLAGWRACTSVRERSEASAVAFERAAVVLEDLLGLVSELPQWPRQGSIARRHHGRLDAAASKLARG